MMEINGQLRKEIPSLSLPLPLYAGHTEGKDLGCQTVIHLKEKEIILCGVTWEED